jgi:hypothetical protein
MKRLLFLACASLFLFGAALTADVGLFDLGDGTVEITFTRPASDEAEMFVIGSFNEWAEPGTPMEINQDGLWELRIYAGTSDEIQYKFFSEGIYYGDANAPETRDDGFGGTNGFISVPNLLIEQKVASGEITAEEAESLVRKKLYFSMLTYFESETLINTENGAFQADSTGINAVSRWKFAGDLLSGMPGYIELTFVDGSNTLWERGGITFADGLESMVSGLLFTPAYYLGAGSRPALAEFSFGFDTPWVNYYTGYGDAEIPGRNSILWPTIAFDTSDLPTTLFWDARKDYSDTPGILPANSGYALITLGDSLREIGPLRLDIGLLPNKSINNFYGIQSWVQLGYGPVTVDFQYNMRSSTTDEPYFILEDIPRQDIIGGLGFEMGPLFIGAQAVYPMYVKGGPTDMLPLEDKLGAEVRASYEMESLFAVTVGAKYRGGLAAQMIMADNDVVLGPEESISAYLSASATFADFITPRLNTMAILSSKDTTASPMVLGISPGIGVELNSQEESGGLALTADAYADLMYVNIPMTSESEFELLAIGVMAETGTLVPGIIEGLRADLGLDFSDPDTDLYSILAEVAMPADISIQAGAALRSGLADSNAFGMVLGASWMIPAESIKTPVLYANFSYNIDPYDDETRYAYDLNDSIPVGGVNNSDGEAAIRFGIHWEY